MVKLEEAAGRLEEALTRLGSATEAYLAESSELAARPSAEQFAVLEQERRALKDELERLRAEHRRLSAALHDVQENYASTQVVNEAVAGRLDITINQLNAILET